jgi:conjugal transfer pilus assembly protein TraU
LKNWHPERAGRRLVYGLALWVGFVAAWMVPVSKAHADPTCYGKFPNYVTDVCWSCAFPIKVFGNTTLISQSQEDTANPDTKLCVCGNPPTIGTTISFWEAARMADVTKTPYCFVGLGGVKIDAGVNSMQFGQIDNHSSGIRTTRGAFRHVHWYVNPLMTLLGVLVDSHCTERQGFDIAYMSEIDPSYGDDELEGILNPDAFIFGGVVAQGACSADCVSSTVGFGRSEMFWCAGCNGSLYPLGGSIQTWIGGVQGSSLMVQRVSARLHRMLTNWSAYGSDGLCGYYPQILMDKTQYKYSMLYPVPQTRKIAGRCCQPFGRSTILWGAGREIPQIGEDFSYLIFRKRNCCEGASL